MPGLVIEQTASGQPHRSQELPPTVSDCDAASAPRDYAS